MILLDALYINEGGGKVLLEYLISCLQPIKKEVVYLLDRRCLNELKLDSDIEVYYLDASLINRYRFYKLHKGRFDKVFCFGNLPPLQRLDCDVYTYFHQTMYLNISKEFNLKFRLFFKLKQTIFNFIKQNTTYWLVQNDKMKKGLIEKYNIRVNKILNVPFYQDNDLLCGSKDKEKDTFIYVSNATPNKNHKALVKAFCQFYDNYKRGKLILTVSEKYVDLYNLIKRLQEKGYPIDNIGFVGREELISNYQEAEYLIFPSLEESFGLGIVEAIECGCKVIGADLPYMHQVCSPSIMFDPFSVQSIEQAFVKAVNKEEKETKQKIFNEIDQLISLLKN
ncbi:glycosyltransferase [Myroides marinus]|uniref:glycosyltransferase n=1 Tax=Myroides marinus TaxID=703342 RepID=UPI0025757C53|nr:glycosyltransferase [Myroides marinus]MDM1384250.1 glycosyltransferase [Myroides marinus]